MSHLEVPHRTSSHKDSHRGRSGSQSHSQSQSYTQDNVRSGSNSGKVTRAEDGALPQISATSTPSKNNKKSPLGHELDGDSSLSYNNNGNGNGHGDYLGKSTAESSPLIKPLHSGSGSFHLHHHNHPSNNEDTSASASHFISSIVSAAKDAASSWGMGTGDEDSHSKKDSNNNNEFGEDDDTNSERLIEEPVGADGYVSRSAAAAVPINPMRSTISTLGKGQLSLDTLDQANVGSGGGTAYNSNRNSLVLNSTSNHNSNHNSSHNLAGIAGTGPGTGGISRSSSLKSPASASYDSTLAGSANMGQETSEFHLPQFHHRRSAGNTNTGSAAGSREPSRSASTSRPDNASPAFMISEPSPDYSDAGSEGDDHPQNPQTKKAGSKSPERKSSTGKRRKRGVGTSVSTSSNKRETRVKHITGFAFADRKRNREFHRIFRSISADDYLLDDFSCALSREILLQGRLYVSERHICFNSNILGWVTNLVIAFDEMVSLEKKNTAGLFPNGIVIQTLHARHSFASFVSRDSTIDFIQNIWKQSGLSKKNRAVGSGSGAAVDSASEDDDDNDDASSLDYTDSEASKNDSDSIQESLSDDGISDSDLSKELASSDESLSIETSDEDYGGNKTKEKEKETAHNTESEETESNKIGWPVKNLGPETHAACASPSPSSPEKVIFSGVVRAPLGVVANLVYGDNTDWYFRFLTNIEKNYDIKSMPKFQDKARNYEYTKPLNSSVGPKSTKCICKETIEKWDFEGDDGVVIATTTSTPNVPSGNSFVTKSRTYLTWTDHNYTEVTGSYWMEWSARSLFRVPIEKGAEDGQVQSCKDLVEEVNKYLSSSAKSGKPEKKLTKASTAKKPTSKKVHKRTKVESSVKSTVAPAVEPMGLNVKKLYPIYLLAFVGLIFIFIAVFRPLLMHDGSSEHQKLVKLEQEYDMWKWIDDRGRGSGTKQSAQRRLQTLDAEDIYKKHSKQEMEELIRITQMRIDMLKQKIGNESS